LKRRQEYFSWAQAVVLGIRGTNSKMEKVFDGLVEQSKGMQ
jgi:guanosine-3',5'-bis(diphosphate) 3'-pyrophosphohydrolase